MAREMVLKLWFCVADLNLITGTTDIVPEALNTIRMSHVSPVTAGTK